MKPLALLAIALTVGLGGIASAAPCRDAKGKFVTCPPAAVKKCRDSAGKFTKCSATNVKTP